MRYAWIKSFQHTLKHITVNCQFSRVMSCPKVNASTKTILVTFFWGLFWGLFFIWRLFWRLFIQKIVAKLKIVPKIVFKQKMNLKITLWAKSHQNNHGRCVHLKYLYCFVVPKNCKKKCNQGISWNVCSSAHHHTLRNLYKVNPSIKQQKKLEHILPSRQIIFLHVRRLPADVISCKVFSKHLSNFLYVLSSCEP